MSFSSNQCLWPLLQQAVLLLQHSAAGLASQEEHSFFVEQQEARKKEAEASVTVRIRIIVSRVGWERCNYEARPSGRQLTWWPELEQEAGVVAWRRRRQGRQR